MGHSKIVAVSFVISAVALACGSAGEDTGKKPSPVNAQTKDGDKKAGGDAKAGTPTSEQNPTTPTGQSGEACFEACTQANAAGASAFGDLEKTATTCRCAADACQTACAQTVCKANASDEDQDNPDAACSTCLEGATSAACGQALEDACNANADCKKVMECYAKCEGGGGGENDD